MTDPFVYYVEYAAHNYRLLLGNKPWQEMPLNDRYFLRGINAVVPFGSGRFRNRYRSYRMLVEMLSWPE